MLGCPLTSNLHIFQFRKQTNLSCVSSDISKLLRKFYRIRNDLFYVNSTFPETVLIKQFRSFFHIAWVV